MYKQAILIRKDIKMSKGKACAQAAHASISSSKNSKTSGRWMMTGQKKIVLKATLKEIKDAENKCKKLKIPCALIHDAGFTEVMSGTITALGIGPDDEKKINKITGSLPLLK